MNNAAASQREHFRIADLRVEVDTARVLRGSDEITLPKLSFDLLVALLRRAPAVVTFDQLMDDVWGNVVVGPETVTQRVKLVRDALGDDSRDPRYIAPVRGRGYRVVADVERLGADDDIQVTPRWRHIVIGGVAMTGIAIAAWLFGVYQARESPRPVDPASIAILPFDSLGADPENRILADGIHEDVLTRVSQVGSIRVISRTSVEALDRGQTIPQIAAQLGVASVLEGSVQRADDRIRVNVQLIDGNTDVHVWSQNYDRQLNIENLFNIQSDIANRVAEQLRARLSPGESERLQREQTTSFEAWESYLLGRQRIRNRNTADLGQAQEDFRRAIQLDPEFAAAYLGLAETLRLQASFGTLSARTATEQATILVERAIALDPNLGEAYAMRGTLHRLQLRFEAAEHDFLRALQLSPGHAESHHAYGQMLAFRNRMEEAIGKFNAARRLDPLSGAINASVATALRDSGRYEEALEQYRHTVDIAPEFAGGYRGIAELYWTVFARPDEAYAWRLKILELDPGDPVNPAVIGLICLDLGDPDLAQYWIERALDMEAERRRPLWAMEALHGYRGETDLAREYAERVAEYDPLFRFTVTHLRNLDARAGRIDDALARYRRLFPDFVDNPDPDVEFYNYIAAIDIAWLLQQQGNHERAAMLLERSLRAIGDLRRLGPRGYAIADVEIYALQGKHDLALATLRDAVDSGWRMQWWFWLDQSPNLDSIRDDPRFAAIRADIVAEAANYLARVRSLGPAPEHGPKR